MNNCANTKASFRCLRTLAAATLILTGLGSTVHAASTDSVWNSMRRGFAMEGHASHPSVLKQLKKFKRQHTHIERTSRRAQPFLFYIVQEVNKRGMPLEVALIPMVESAFDPYAYSPSKAAGLWQFMPKTGQRFNLRSSYWYEGRRDLVDATRAALDYLTILVRRFDGDWELALAAYNAGGGAVSAAIRRNRKAGLPTDFFSLKLPKETRDYVPRILALANVIRAPYQHNVKLHPIPNRPAIDIVSTQLQIDLAKAAQWADISMSELYRLNSAFNRWASDPRGPHRLILPVDRAARFKRNLNSKPMHARMNWKRHEVQQGETLSEIADEHENTQEVLLQVNQLRSARLLKSGQSLLIPTPSKQLKHYPREALARVDRVHAQRKARLTKAKARRAQRRERKVSHKIKNGESLWSIAHKYQVHVKDLKRWNRLGKGTVILPGRSLTVWYEPKNKSIKHTVRAGESLWTIAKKYQVRVAELRQWNDLGSQHYIRPGQEIKLVVSNS